MRHHMYNPDFKFVVEPEHFNKYTDRELLQYCLGADVYADSRTCRDGITPCLV